MKKYLEQSSAPEMLDAWKGKRVKIKNASGKMETGLGSGGLPKRA